MPSEKDNLSIKQSSIALYFAAFSVGLSMLFWGASNLNLVDKGLFLASVILGFVIMTIAFFYMVKIVYEGKKFVISEDAIKAGLNAMWDYTIALVAAIMGGVTFWVLQNIFPNPKDLPILILFTFIVVVIFILILGGVIIIFKSFWKNHKKQIRK